MKSILITTLLSTVNAHLSPEPCEVIANPTGSATAFSFSCNVETKQLNGKMKATFSRPFELMAKEGIMLPDTRKDIISGAASPFSYYFNPLGDLPAASAILKDKGCAETHGNTWSAGAYQWDSRLKAAGGCTRLTGAAEGGMTKYAYNGWSAYLLDIEDATQGIMIHMSGGDACGTEGARKFNISLMCDTSALAESKPYIEEAVSEDQTCTYEIDLETTHGCPDECKAPFNVFENGKYSKRRRSNVAVIHVRIVFINAFFFYCLLLNHSFPTNPNKITNCFKLILSIYNFTTTLLLLSRYF